MSLDDLNSRIDELISSKRTEYEKLHEERNQLQMDLNDLTPVSYTHLTLPTNREV